jgi:hypothetical protein
MQNKKIEIYDMAAFAPPPNKKPEFAEGIIRVRRIPDWSEEEYRYWWLPETDGHGKILRPARISEWDKEHEFQTDEFRNLITTNGRNNVLSYIGSSSGSTTQWSQYFAVGTGAITYVSASDTSLANEVFRKAFTSFSVSGTQVDMNLQFGSGEGLFTFTNSGIFGNGATSTIGSGQLQTHALFAFSHGAFSIAIDYLVNLL